MWFLFLGIALSLVLVGGLYFRRRFVGALETLGVQKRTLRVVRYLVLYLLFAYPVLVFAFVVGSVVLGQESFTLEPSGMLMWVLVWPFWISVLVVLQSLSFFLLIDLAGALVRKTFSVALVQRYRSSLCLAVVFVFALYTPGRIILERDTLHVHHYEIGEDSGDAFRIAFVADLQRDAHTDTARTEHLVDLVNEQAADLILFGGDWVNTGSDYIDEAASAGGGFTSRLGTFSVRGDHEHFAYRDYKRSVVEVTKALEEQGVQMPNNEVRWFEHEGKRIGVAFLSYNYIVRSPEAVIRKLMEELESADYAILLTHQFDSFVASLAEDRVDLVLAGHTHGGQVNPVLGFFHVPIARVETAYVEGRYRLGSRTTVIVTAGIGFSIAPFRYASPASFEILDLRL